MKRSVNCNQTKQFGVGAVMANLYNTNRLAIKAGSYLVQKRYLLLPWLAQTAIKAFPPVFSKLNKWHNLVRHVTGTGHPNATVG